MTRRRVWLCGLVILCVAGRAWAADPAEFSKGTTIATVNIGGGVNMNLPVLKSPRTDVSLVNGSARVGYLPFEPFGRGALRGTVEAGLEPFVQLYLDPAKAAAEGLKAVARYHFLSAGPLVPYGEFTMGVMHSNLKTKEIRSLHAFVLESGGGLSYLISKDVALTGGYRFQHISNASTESPNVGINSNTGVVGISFFFH